MRHTETDEENYHTAVRLRDEQGCGVSVSCLTQARGARAHRLLLLRERNSVPFQGGQGNPDSPTDDHSQSRAQDRKSLSM